MVGTDQQQEDRHQNETGREVIDHECNRSNDRDPCNPMSLFANQRIDDMPTVELADGHHVQSGN